MWPPLARKRGMSVERLESREGRMVGEMGKLPEGEMNSFWTSMIMRALVEVMGLIVSGGVVFGDMIVRSWIEGVSIWFGFLGPRGGERDFVAARILYDFEQHCLVSEIRPLFCRWL